MVKSRRRRSTISELGEELWVEILCRLGYYKYAIQCKSVCKLWCAIINNGRTSDSYFFRRWHQINGKEEGELPLLLLTKLRCYTGQRQTLEGKYGTFETRLTLDHASPNDPNTNGLPTLNLNFLPCTSNPGDQSYLILSACKDLLLCCPDPSDHSCYYLCNPFTKQWTTLPPPPLPTEDEEDDGDEYYSVGIGLSVYDEDHALGSRFVVVRVVSYHSAGIQDVHILVFSSDGSNGGWRKIGCSDEFHEWGYSCTNVVSYNGDFAWITIPSDRPTELLGFNLNPYPAYTSSVYQPELLSESFSGPLGYKKPNMVTYESILGVSQGHLRLAELVDQLVGQRKLIIWQWYHGPRQVWEKVHELDFSELEDSENLSIARNGRNRTSLLAFHPHDGDILYLSFSMLIYGPKIKDLSYTFSCNLAKKRLELIRDIPVVIRKDSFFPLLLPCWPTSVPQLVERESSKSGSSP